MKYQCEFWVIYGYESGGYLVSLPTMCNIIIRGLSEPAPAMHVWSHHYSVGGMDYGFGISKRWFGICNSGFGICDDVVGMLGFWIHGVVGVMASLHYSGSTDGCDYVLCICNIDLVLEIIHSLNVYLVSCIWYLILWGGGGGLLLGCCCCCCCNTIITLLMVPVLPTKAGLPGYK